MPRYPPYKIEFVQEVGPTESVLYAPNALERKNQIYMPCGLVLQQLMYGGPNQSLKENGPIQYPSYGICGNKW